MVYKVVLDKKTGCNMTSVMFKECCLFAKENHSKYACFLDVQKAFDKIWHNGLFFKTVPERYTIKFASGYHQPSQRHDQSCSV